MYSDEVLNLKVPRLLFAGSIGGKKFAKPDEGEKRKVWRGFVSRC